MPIGECKLCLQKKELQQSHLCPRALYELCDSPDSNPVLVTSEVVMQTSRQLQHYLLCRDCEQLLNRQGENWVIPKVATIEGTFPFFDILSTSKPTVVDGDHSFYSAASIPEIQIPKLVHFALGIFWKASVHSWAAKQSEPSIELGPYSDAIRRLLLGEAHFPKHLALVMFVQPPRVKLIHFNNPYECVRQYWGRNFTLYVPGIQFRLLIGKQIPEELRVLCLASNPQHPIIVTDVATDIARVVMSFYESAHKSKKHLEHMASLKATRGRRKNLGC